MIKTVIFIGLFLLVSGCATKEVPAPVSPVVREAEEKGIKVKTSWQEEWDKTLALAKKEGKLTIFSFFIPFVREAWIENFGKKFEIDMEFIIGRGAETSTRLLTERRAGLTTGDLVITGLTTIYLVLDPVGIFEEFEGKLFLPEVLDTNAWFGERLPWFNKRIFSWRLYPTENFYINTTILKPGDITSYRDLLKPQWKGRKFVLNDPTTSGPGSKWFEVYGLEQFLGLDYMKALVKQEPVVVRDMRLGANWVAQGKYPFSVAIPNTTYQEFAAAGAPVAFLELKEPPYMTAGAGNLAWIKDNPHPAAAKLFANWLLTREGQEITQKASKNQSAREDTGIEGVEMGSFRKKGVKYFRSDTQEYYDSLSQLKTLAQEIFSPLVR